MDQPRTELQIATTVFKALPHIDKVWVDAKAQQFHLFNKPGATLLERSKVMASQVISDPAKTETKPEPTAPKK